MKNKRILPLLLLTCLLLTACRSYFERISQREDTAKTQIQALVGVNVIPIAPAGILSNQTVLVENGKIRALGPQATIAIPPGAEIIPLQGKYLLPGFADMHVHLADQRDLLIFLKHGITQVRNMAHSPNWARLVGFPDVRELREQVKNQQLWGPKIFACGEILDGSPAQNGLNRAIATRSDAIAAVKETVEAGFDCVKVYNRLSRENFDQIVETAHAYKIPVMGHVPVVVGIDRALEAKMASIEHLNAYVENFAGYYRIPADQLEAYGRKTAQAGVFNCPTLVMWDHHPPYGDFSPVAHDPRFKELPPYLRSLWYGSVPELYKVTYADPFSYPSHLLALSKRMVKALSTAGSPLVIGTDANLTGVYPGSSALREMELFAEAGIPPEGILQAATLNAARLLKQEHESGSVSVGKQADFVVLNANPLEDIRNVRQTAGVFVQGRWLSLGQINQWLAESRPPSGVPHDPGSD